MKARVQFATFVEFMQSKGLLEDSFVEAAKAAQKDCVLHAESTGLVSLGCQTLQEILLNGTTLKFFCYTTSKTVN